MLYKTAIANIRKSIQEEDQRLRKAYPILRFQTAIGALFWLVSLASLMGNAWLYRQGWIPWYVALPFAALPLSIFHELEHDLIHKQYFPTKKWVQDTLLSSIWILKSSQEMSPFIRRDLHLHHHENSGQVDDIEERLIGLGIQSNMFRIVSAFVPSLALIYIYAPEWGLEATTNWRLFPGKYWYSKENWMSYFDSLLINAPLLLGFLTYLGYDWAQFLFVCWAAPNVLRHACLVFMSSYSHYYLAEEANSRGDITLQNQILNHWSLLPFQLFCCNFGAEHILHHYVVSQPFYLRHLSRKKAWTIMIQNGIPNNDLSVIWRANQREPTAKNNLNSAHDE